MPGLTSNGSTFGRTLSTDPLLVAKVTDVVGLYLAPPENAIEQEVRRPHR